MKPDRTRKHGPGVSAPAAAELMTIPLDLVADPNLPARESMDQGAMDDLMQSLRDLGLLSPIVVVRRRDEFEVVAGHRRTIAARALHWTEIRAFVYPEGWEDADAAMLHENIVRENLNAAQEAVFFSQLLDKHKLDEASLCRLVKRSADYIGDRLDLLRKDPKVFEALRSGAITYAVARVLNRFPDETWRRYYLHQAITSGTSARVVQEWWDAFKVEHFPDVQRVNQDTPLPASVTAAPSSSVECFLCGGSKDPYNLVSVLIHKWELTEIHRLLRTAELKEQDEAGDTHALTPAADKPGGGVQ